MNIIIAIIILSIIVIIHEFGHFIVAKANGIAVSEFALGLGPTILKFKKKGTLFFPQASAVWRSLYYGGGGWK